MNVVIIGNGISGITAAIELNKFPDHNITVISKESEFHFSRPGLMYAYMGHMRKEDLESYDRKVYRESGINFLMDEVLSLELHDKKLGLRNSTLSYDKLIIATGSKPNFFGWKGQDLNGVTGFYSLQDLEFIESRSTKESRAVVVGGGLIGLELVEMFHSRNIPVTFVIRESHFWKGVLPREESLLISEHILKSGYDVKFNSNLKEVLGDENGEVSSIKILETGEEISCNVVGIATGVSPNIDFLKDSGLDFNRGVLVNEYLQTSDSNVYAIGDCAELRDWSDDRRPIEAVWYAGKNMAKVVVDNLEEHSAKYDQGIWYNSAKFLDVEYQIYGTVSKDADQGNSLYWQHPTSPKAIRITYDPDSLVVLGFSLLGIRYRQEVCVKWVSDHTHLRDVIINLNLANFDPEFYDTYEEELVELFNQKFREKITLVHKKSTFNKVLTFLKR